MNTEDKIKRLIYNYLDELFSKVRVVKYNSGLIGSINGNMFFKYFVKYHIFIFDIETFETLRYMFSVDEDTLTIWIKSYLTIWIKSYLTKEFNLPPLYFTLVIGSLKNEDYFDD